MSERYLIATFEHEDDLCEATTAVRQEGYKIVDVYMPYAIHGFDKIMGIRPSRLTWVCFLGAMLGALSMFWFEHWSAAVSWAIEVGGKPWNSLPSDVPVAFELAVLFAGFGSVFALFAVCRLFPGKKPKIVLDRATNDQFVIVLKEADAAFKRATVERLLSKFNVKHVEERIE